MKTLTFIVIFLLFSMNAFSSLRFLASGTYPGEIYFTGFLSSIVGYGGFYYSSDYGEHIVLRDSASPGFGSLLPDAADSTIYRLAYYALLYTTDNGFSWNAANTSYTFIYASGIIPGEVYRQMYDHESRLERSGNYGANFTPCACNGVPDSLGMYSAALGSDSGEVYIWGDHGKLYYSDDHGETFTLLGDMYTTWGINPWTDLINGAIPGEVFVFDDEAQRIWRISDYRAHAEMISEFNLNSTWNYLASRNVPGELYFLGLQSNIIPGGTMYILHTQDYFQTWSTYIHYMNPSGIEVSNDNHMPDNISLQVYPNPTNAAFSIFYNLNTVQNVQLMIYNLLGQVVWQLHQGIQFPGNYQINTINEQLPSGTYFIQLNTENLSSFKTISIIK